MFMAQFSSWVFRVFMTTVKNKNEKKKKGWLRHVPRFACSALVGRGHKLSA